LKHKGYNNNVSANSNSVARRFMFGGKEFNDELGLDWYDVSARNYDPALGRWMNLDPLAEDMTRHSPYNFGFNNPIYFQDYDGMAPSGPGDPPSLWGFVKTYAKAQVNGVKNYVSNTYNGVKTLVKNPGVLFTPDTKTSFKDRVVNAAINSNRTIKAAFKIGKGYQEGGVEGALTAQAEVQVSNTVELATTLGGGGLLSKADDAVNAAAKVSNKVDDVAALSDDALVVRGGSNTPDRFDGGSGVSSRLSDRMLDGISVNSKTGSTIEELSKGIPHKKVGVTTVGAVRKAGGDVISSPTKYNPNHATMSIPNSKTASSLMNVIIKPIFNNQ
ncbi:RHS repeat domain-containing protein, partial [Winogradskyella luteola]